MMMVHVDYYRARHQRRLWIASAPVDDDPLDPTEHPRCSRCGKTARWQKDVRGGKRYHCGRRTCPLEILLG